MYYDSVVINAKEVHFLLHQETMKDPKVKQHLKVLFLSTALPAQSESIYSRHFVAPLFTHYCVGVTKQNNNILTHN